MHRTRTTNAYGTTAATQEGGDWDLFIELRVVDDAGGTPPSLRHFGSRRDFEAVLSPKLRMVQGTEGRLSKCLVCEQILAPAMQLASHAAPRLRISFPQAWPWVGGQGGQGEASGLL